MASPAPALSQWNIGAATVTRIPYFDIGLPAESIGLSTEAIQGVIETTPEAGQWLDGEGQPLVGQAFWVVESAASTIVVDPCSASDAFLRSGPEAIDHQTAAFAAFRAAGFDPLAVDTVILSHLDGIGMAATMTADGGWEPAFPSARLLVSRSEYNLIAAHPDIPGAEVFALLDQAGVVSPVELPHRVTDEIELTGTGGHSEGHLVVAVSSEGDHAVLLGHLAISPIDLLTPHGASQLHVDPTAAATALAKLLDTAFDRDAVVFGPLWPAPGAIRIPGMAPTRIEAAPA